MVEQRLTPQQLKTQFLRPRNISEERPEILEQIQDRELKKRQEALLRSQAEELDREFVKAVWGSIAEFVAELSKIPTNIRQYMKIDEGYIISEHNKLKDSLSSKLNQRIRQEDKISSRKNKDFRDKADLEGVRVEIDLLQQLQQELNKGLFLDLNSSYNEINSIVKKVKNEVKLVGFNQQRLNQLKIEALETSNQVKSFLDKELTKIDKGERPSRLQEYLKFGFDVQTYNNLIQSYETGEGIRDLKNLNTDKFFKFALDENGNVKPNLAVDYVASVQAFKIAVKKEVDKAIERGFKIEPLKFSDSVTKFQTSYNEINKFKDSLARSIGKTPPKNINVEELGLLISRGDNITPNINSASSIKVSNNITNSLIALNRINEIGLRDISNLENKFQKDKLKLWEYISPLALIDNEFRLSKKLNILRLNAVNNNELGKAKLLGGLNVLINLDELLVKYSIEFIRSIITLEVISALISLPSSIANGKAQQSLVKFGQELNKGNPNALFELGILFTPLRIPRGFKVSSLAERTFLNSIKLYDLNLANRIKAISSFDLKGIKLKEFNKLKTIKKDLDKGLVTRDLINDAKRNKRTINVKMSNTEIQALASLFKPRTLSIIEKNLDKIVKERNIFVNRINRLENKLVKVNKDSIEAQLLTKYISSGKKILNVYDNLRLSISKSNLSDKAKLIEFKKIDNSIKRLRALDKLSIKIDKLSLKIKRNGYKDLNTLPPNIRDKIKKVISQLDNSFTFSLAKINSLSKQLDNLLKISFKKFKLEETPKIDIKKTNEELKKARASVKRNRLNKEELNNILSKSKGKELLETRINLIEKQIISIRSNLLENIFLIPKSSINTNLLRNSTQFKSFLRDLLKSRELSRVERVKIFQVEGLAFTLENRLKQIRILLKKSNLQKPNLDELQILRRKKAFEEARKNKEIIIRDSVKGNLIKKEYRFTKFGFEFEIRYTKPNTNLRTSKKGSLSKPSFQVIVRPSSSSPRLKNFSKYKDQTQKQFSRALNSNQYYKNANRNFGKLEQLETRLKRKLDLTKDPIMRKKFRQAQKPLIKQIELQKKALERLLSKIFDLVFYFTFAQIRVQDRALERTLAKALDKVSKNVSQLELKLKQIGKNIKPKPSNKPKSKKTLKKSSRGKLTAKKITSKPPKASKPPKPSKVKRTPPFRPKRFRLPDPNNAESIINKGLTPSYNIEYLERRNKNLLYNAKTNPRIVKTIKVELPKNLAVKRAVIFIKQVLARRFRIVLVGTTTKKDILLTPSLLKDFRITKTPNALIFVEKSSSALKSSSAKKELKQSSRLMTTKKKSKKVVTKKRPIKRVKVKRITKKIVKKSSNRASKKVVIKRKLKSRPKSRPKKKISRPFSFI